MLDSLKQNLQHFLVEFLMYVDIIHKATTTQNGDSEGTYVMVRFLHPACCGKMESK